MTTGTACPGGAKFRRRSGRPRGPRPDAESGAIIGGVRASPARLVIALSVAAALAIFVFYTAVAGAGTPQIQPSDLAKHHGDVLLVGAVVGPVTGNAHSAPMRFRLKNVQGRSRTVAVSYTGSVPDLFKVGRHVVVEGTLHNGVFVSKPGSLVTKCPSKYAPAKSTSSD